MGFHWLSVVGTRPQFVKLASFCNAVAKHNQGSSTHIRHTIIHTGQHYAGELADLFFDQLRIPQPKHNLGVGSALPGEQLARMLERLESVMMAEEPDFVLVYGDTNSTLAGALIAARLRIPLAHIEAGCRSYKPGMPEEQNRILSDHLSQLLLVPSQRAAENLLREGIGTAGDPLFRRICWVGDTMLDVLLANAAAAEQRSPDTLRRFGLEHNGYYLLTFHRAENTENTESLAQVLNTLQSMALPVLFPVHPRTRKLLPMIGNHDRRPLVRIVSPLGYVEMLSLERHARAILTDSGGVQKEAFYLRVPCVTLRNETEWPETVIDGANRLAGTDPDAILAALKQPFPDLWNVNHSFGNGHAGENIVREILSAQTMAFSAQSHPATRSTSRQV